MTSARIERLLVALSGVFFAAVALAIWLSPESAGQQAGVQAIRREGSAMLRADFGGLFAGLAALCGAAAWTRRRAFALAAAAMLAAVLTGRILGWISAGRIGSDAVAGAIELALLLVLAASARRPAMEASAPATPAGRTNGNRRRWALATAALLVLPIAGVAALLTPSMEQRITDAAANRRAATINTAPLDKDALRVAVCGSSAPLPSAARAKACVAVFAGGRFFVVDTGPESVENLVLWGIPLSSVGGVLLTHFHSDHIGDLGELNLQTWAAGRPAPLRVFGGPGIEQVVAGFSEAYRLDQGYRTAHHTERVMPSATWPMIARTITMPDAGGRRIGRTAVVLEEDGLRITAVEVNHAPISPAYAYRFDYNGRSAFITGDLKFDASLAQAAAGVDLFLSEAIAPSMTRALGQGASSAGRARTAAVMHDIEDYHITPEQAADAANGAGAQLLAFYHLLPAPDNAMTRRVFARGLDQRRSGGWTIADDGSLYTMPLGSREVRIGRVNE